MTTKTPPPSTAPTPPSDIALRTSPLAGAILATFLATGLLSCGWLAFSGKLELLPGKALSNDQVLEGEITHRIAKELAKAPLAEHAAQLERGGSWLLLGDTGPRVREGCPNWLFINDELKINRHAAQNAQAKAAAVVALRDRLKQRGIELLVSVVPDKSRIAASQLCALPRPASLEARVRDWTALLQASGVAVVDLAPTLQPLGAEAFLRLDTHWSEAGAHAAAEAIAGKIAGLGFQATPSRDFDISQGAPSPRPGDLVRLAGLEWLPARLQPAQEQVAASTISEHTPDADTGGDIGSYDSRVTPTVPANLAAMGYGITVASPTSVIGNVAVGTPADIKGHLSVGVGAENSAAFLSSIKGSVVGPTTPSGTTVDANLVSYDFNESYEDVQIPTAADVAAKTGLTVSQLTTLPSETTSGANKGWIVIGDKTGASIQRFKLTGSLTSGNLLILGPVQIILPSGDFSPDGTYVLDGTKNVPQLKSNGNPDSAVDTTTGRGWAEVYVEGDIVLNGAPGSLNAGSRPSLLKVFGTIDAAEAKAGNTQDVVLNGNADITALVYSPWADVKLNGGGSNGYFAGALVANSIKIGGNGYRFVYDVSASNEDITGFRLSRWIEFVKGPDPVTY